MSNTGTLQIKMDGLWGEEAFWDFFSQAQNLRKELTTRRQYHVAAQSISSPDFLSTMRKHIPEQRLQELYKEDFLNGTRWYPPIDCILKDTEPDSVTTIARYTYDNRLALALAEIFPDREIRCSWFIDGVGDYGSFTLRGTDVLNETSGNLQEDLSKADGFYCVCRQRDPDRNPGNKPCPDTDKCHLCGQHQLG